MQRPKTREMAQLAILSAILLVFAFTPLGFLKVGLIEITFLILPVAIGATVLGPTGGAVLGFLFGVLSFIQCFTGSVFGALVLDLNPAATVFMCIVPRVLCGWLSGLVFKLLYKRDATKTASFFVATLSTALLNTVFFVLSLLLLFWNNDKFLSTMAEWGLPTDSVWAFVVAFVAVNGVIEAVVNCILGGAIGKAIMKFVNKQ